MFSRSCFMHAFSYIFFLYEKYSFKFLTKSEWLFQQNYAIKNIGHPACLRENGDLSLSGAKPYRKSRHFVYTCVYVRVLITLEILRSKNGNAKLRNHLKNWWSWWCRNWKKSRFFCNIVVVWASLVHKFPAVWRRVNWSRASTSIQVVVPLRWLNTRAQRLQKTNKHGIDKVTISLLFTCFICVFPSYNNTRCCRF